VTVAVPGLVLKFTSVAVITKLTPAPLKLECVYDSPFNKVAFRYDCEYPLPSAPVSTTVTSLSASTLSALIPVALLNAMKRSLPPDMPDSTFNTTLRPSGLLLCRSATPIIFRTNVSPATIGVSTSLLALYHPI
jgi:hypothetical protein